jgi:DNA-binding CsgD family transcriptional regulator
MVGTVFVGRRAELERLGQVMRGDPGDAAAAVVTGDAGIGKTRLLAEAVRAAPDVLVLSGTCLPLSESLPYGAVTDAFATLTGPSGRPALERALIRCAPYVRGQVAALIPALIQGTGTASDAALDRTRLFAAVRDLLAALGAERRTALVVEDLHWADPGTLDLLTFLVRAVPAGTALVATSRRDELQADSPALDWLATTARLPNVESVTLAQLQREEVAALVASLVEGAPGAGFVAEVVRRGEGSPFFTEQLVAAARDVAPPLAVPAGVPHGVAQMLLGRVRSVSAVGAEVAAALAVAARPMSEAELAGCVGTGVEVAAGLRELLDAHLVELAVQDRYRLRHALLEDTVRGTLLGSQRAGLHAGVARVLAARAGEAPGEVAAHWGRAGHSVQEARWSVAAARHAENVFAWQEAGDAWRRVWDLWASLPYDERPPVGLSEVVVGCVVAAGQTNRIETFMGLAREALADHRVTADDEAAGLLMRLYADRLLLTDIPVGMAAMEKAVALFDRTGRPGAEQARTLLRHVNAKIIHRLTTGTEDAELERAAAIAEQVGAVDVQIELAAERGSRRLGNGQVEGGLADLLSARQLAGGDASADEATAAAGTQNWSILYINLSDAYLWLLRLEEGIEIGRRGIDRGVEQGRQESFGFSIVVGNTVECLLLHADVASAAQLVARFQPLEMTTSAWPLHLARAELDLLGGDLTAAMERVERLEAMGNNDDELWMWLAEIGPSAHLWRRRPAEAWEQFERCWPVVRASTVASHAGRMLAVAAQAAADLADLDPRVDRAECARQLRGWAEQAACFAGHPALVLGTAFGSTFHAELARLQRIGEETAWRAARDTWISHGVPHHAAYAGWRLAEQLVATGRPKDAETELATSYPAAEHFVPLRHEIEGLARRARLSLPVADQAAPATAEVSRGGDTHGLTPRELDVLQLLGSGATNAEIGRRLYMSPKTASVHVSAILRKLGVSGRFQAATVAQRKGLLTADDDAGRNP